MTSPELTRKEQLDLDRSIEADIDAARELRFDQPPAVCEGLGEEDGEE